MKWPCSLIVVLALAVGCDKGTSGDDEGQGGRRSAATRPTSRKIEKVREPAVAGQFYPGKKAELTKMIDGFLAQVKGEPIGKLRALICPHAGYIYSGPTAAYAYKQLVGRDIQTVIILAPSHTAYFQGASVPDADAYRTPLGLVEISLLADELAKGKPFVRAPKVRIRGGREGTPHTYEHSLEVQLPFLQKVLKDFRLVPVVFGQVDPQAVAGKLADRLDDKTLLIASSDLSHYKPYDEAIGIDRKCIDAIRRLDTKGIDREQACGRGPILTLMHLAKKKGWKVQLLDYRNSGDTAGDKSGVVGYAAIAFFGGDQ